MTNTAAQNESINGTIYQWLDTDPTMTVAEAALRSVLDDFEVDLGKMWGGTPVNELRHIIETYIQGIRTLYQPARIDALREAQQCCTDELRNTAQLMSNPPQSSAAWDARNAIQRLIDQSVPAQEGK